MLFASIIQCYLFPSESITFQTIRSYFYAAGCIYTLRSVICVCIVVPETIRITKNVFYTTRSCFPVSKNILKRAFRERLYVFDGKIIRARYARIRV